MTEKEPLILFADRDLAWGRRARVELRRRGARVETAGTLEEARRAVEASPPDLLFLDGALEEAELFLARLPEAEIVLLEPPGARESWGLRRGLLYAGPRGAAEPRIVELAEKALGPRLSRAAAGGSPTRRVLCVDDEVEYLKSLARMLTRRGYSVSAFDTAERALEAVARAKPDVALVDVMMPGMGGLDLARRIRERSAGKIPIVFVTGLDSDEVHYDAHENGASIVLTKAEEPERVLDAVDYFAGDLDEAERELIKERLKT